MASTRKPGRPINPPPASSAMPWEAPAVADTLAEILIAVEAPPVDAQVQLTLQKHLYRSEMFGTDGRGHVTLLIRTITESGGNQNALVEPIVSAVSSCMRPEWTGLGLKWIEAFDHIPLTAILETMRSLDLFSQQNIGHYLSIALRNKLARILEPARAKPCKPAKPAPKPPLSVTRIPQIEKNIALGLELLAVRSSISGNTQFGRQVRKRFPGVDQITASGSMKVARAYGARPEIYRRLSWIALFELSSPKMSPSVRQAIEAEILAGKSVSATEIRRVRGRLKPGSPKRHPSDQPATRMAA
jgi:hypothetical protein